MLGDWASGELGPDPTMHQLAQGALPLKERFDMILGTNEQVGQSVETLWRLRQSWGMQVITDIYISVCPASQVQRV